ncbi:MAG: gluconate 2-dehydrogenase subunit 3 family protein [Aquabacterium sp.]
MRQPAQRLWPSLPHLRRRWFLQALMAGGFIGWLARLDAQAAVSRPQAASAQEGGRGGSRGPMPPAMPPALPVLVDHLIPADELTPAGSALGVPAAMWREALADAELSAFVKGGCAWLDRYGDGFASLADDEREALCVWMSRADWETPQRRFFHWVRERAFSLYYAQPVSWRGMPFERPPQPIGFSDQRGV